MKKYYSLREIEKAMFNAPKHINGDETKLAEVDMFWYNLTKNLPPVRELSLQEKFEYAPIVYDKELNFVKNYESIADEFAIGFADYCLTIFGRLRDNEITIEEALKLYKKDNNL